jgi:hypothetical protein
VCLKVCTVTGLLKPAAALIAPPGQQSDADTVSFSHGIGRAVAEPTRESAVIWDAVQPPVPGTRHAAVCHASTRRKPRAAKS